MRENYRNSIASIERLPRFTTMNVIDGQAGLVIYTSLIFYSLTIDNILNIIVLLILAGVAISMLSGENGILKQAANAKTQTEEQSTIEQIKLAAIDALMRGNDLTSIEQKKDLEDALLEQGIKNATVTPIEGGYKVTVNGITQIISNSGNVISKSGVEKNVGVKITGSKATLLDANNEQIVVPVGFTIKEDSATLVKDGIVVVGPDKSEFVWIPVTNINSMVMCQGSTGANDCKIEKENGEYVCKTHHGTLCGKLYATSTGNNFNKDLTTQKYTKDSRLRESDKLKDTSSGDAVVGDDTKGINLIAKKVTKIKELVENTENPLDLTTTEGQNAVLSAWETMLQDEFEEMVKYVGENGGFYVGRYETSTNATTNKPQSVANVSSTTASTNSNTWYGLYELQKGYTGVEENVKSSMIWGCQYDQMMLWMQKNGYDVTSTDSTKLKGATKNTSSTTTGITNDTDILNNIYDLLGCHYEWTLEALYTDSRVYRGSFGTSFGPSFRSIRFSPYNTDSHLSSRLILYVQ